MHDLSQRLKWTIYLENFLKKIPLLQADDFGPLNFFEFFKNHCAMLATKQEYNKVLGSTMHIGSFGGNFYV